MKAIVQDTYGPPDVLVLEEIEKPVVDDGEVLIRVHAAAANPLDWHFIRGQPFVARIAMGFPKPKTRFRGVDVAGHIEAVGKDVKDLRTGDEVFGWCVGAFAEYAKAAENHFVLKPANITFEQAAGVPVAAATALQAIRDFAKVQAGQKVLINGAAGGVGTFAVQIAKSYGAEVTGVCSTRNMDMVRSIGADHVVDYTEEDFTKGGIQYDLIFDNAGTHSLPEFRHVLTPNGTFFSNSGTNLGLMLMARVASTFAHQKPGSFLANITHEDLVVLQQLIESGQVKTVVDRTYPLSQTAEAIRYLEAGHARGKVIITV